MKSSHYRGHKIIFKNTVWIYADNLEKVSDSKDRKCGNCEKNNRIDGHDSCIGELQGIKNACCGHGNIDECYIQYPNGNIVSGYDAKKIIDKKKDNQ